MANETDLFDAGVDGGEWSRTTMSVGLRSLPEHVSVTRRSTCRQIGFHAALITSPRPGLQLCIAVPFDRQGANKGHLCVRCIFTGKSQSDFSTFGAHDPLGNLVQVFPVDLLAIYCTQQRRSEYVSRCISVLWNCWHAMR